VSLKRLEKAWLLAIAMISWTPIALANYAEGEAADAVIAAVSEQGVDAAWARDLLAQAEKRQSILDAMSRPAEKTKPWHEYRQIFITPQRIAGGVAFYEQYRETLVSVAEKTGVPAEVIVAIIGVETYYGRIQGSYRVIDALSTLAFDYPARSPFFTQELIHFLVLSWQSGKDPLALNGSYAGAMGWGQFMPSSYRSYAVDYDGDGIRDIWDNPQDAIYSVANYFRAHGWRHGEAVVVGATGSAPEAELFSAGLRPSVTVGQAVAAGLAPTTELFTDTLVTPLLFNQLDGNEYWLGLHNFYVITRYNHSAMYAMAVWQLSQAIRAELVR